MATTFSIVVTVQFDSSIDSAGFSSEVVKCIEAVDGVTDVMVSEIAVS